MRYLKLVLGVILFLYERFLGPKTVTEMRQPSDAIGSLKGYAVKGYELTIFCQRRRYVVCYDRWWVPNRTRVLYRVYSVVTHDAPLSLKKACELDVHLPELISNWNFDNEVRRSQILAYLDLLEKKMALYE